MMDVRQISGALLNTDQLNILGQSNNIKLSADQLVTAQAPTVNFTDTLMSMVKRVDHLDQAAQQKMTAVDRGESDDLVGAMLASQEASLSFSMMMQMRNKLVGAVDDLIKMPV